MNTYATCVRCWGEDVCLDTDLGTHVRELEDEALLLTGLQHVAEFQYSASVQHNTSNTATAPA